MVDKSERAKRVRGIRQDAMNLPNLLTLLRIVIIPVVLWFMVQETRESNIWATIVYGLATATDVIDGWIARRQGLTSVLGKFLDPLADKLVIVATLVLMVELGRVPAWAVIIVLWRELSVTVLRTMAMNEGLVIAASRGGKDKAALQNVAVAMLILHDVYQLDFWFFSVTTNFNTVGLVMFYASIIFALTSGGDYLRLFVQAVELKEKRAAELAAREHQPDGR
jgi:CDP-diacylglycerol--glycerol-3-phosphate 3-phosphatidyltransferase